MSRCGLNICLWALLTTAGCDQPLSSVTVGDRGRPVVYGEDDRVDVYAYDGPWAGRVAEFTAALMSPWDLDDTDPDDVRLTPYTLMDFEGVCPDERFSRQPSRAWCSGTLVAPDLVLTAGHCVRTAAECANTRFVFNYYMIDEETLETITAEDVYACEAIVVRQEAAVDFAVLRMDRPASERTPAAVSAGRDALPLDAPLIVNGSPSGLPIKIDDGGRVRDNRADETTFFVANLDTFTGSSGSGVFLQETGELVGILTNGETDYVMDEGEGCYRVNYCEDNGCGGELVTYAFRAAGAYCDAGGAGLTCPCGDGVCEAGIGEDTTTCPADCGSRCGDGACNGDEDPVACPEDCGTCPNGVCEDGEIADGSCCTDCGCGGDDVCHEGTCIPAPDTGNRCDSPLEIGILETQTLINTTATATADTEGGCAPSAARDRVYTFTLTEEMQFTAAVDGYDTVLYLRSDCENPATEIVCSDDVSEGYGSTLTRRLPPGTYYLFVDGYGESFGDYVLTVGFFVNESTCAFAEEVSPEAGAVIEDTTARAADDYQGSCGGDGADRVYTFTLEKMYDVTVEAGGMDTVLYVRTDCEDAGSQVACNDDRLAGEDVGSRIVMEGLFPGTYHAFLDAFGEGEIGDFFLTFDFAPLDCPDADKDGVCDGSDGCPADPAKLAPELCGCGVPETDKDDDGAPDCVDDCPLDPAKTAPGACGCDAPESDGDGDGAPDCVDLCPSDSGKDAPGVCGCGRSERDSDGDGLPDCDDECPGDPDKISPGDCGCGRADDDRDGDSVLDCDDDCPGDADKTEAGACGCGHPDDDGDGDGALDCEDECPEDPNKDTAGICGCGAADDDADRDDVPDCEDGCPADPFKQAPGACGCGQLEGACDDTKGRSGCRCNAAGGRPRSSIFLVVMQLLS